MKTSVLDIPTLPFDLHKGHFNREPISSHLSNRNPNDPNSKYGKEKLSVYTCTYVCTRNQPFLYKQHIDCRIQYDYNSSGEDARVGWYLVLGDKCEPDELLLRKPVWSIPDWYSSTRSKGHENLVGKSGPGYIRCQDLSLLYQVLGPWPRILK